MNKKIKVLRYIYVSKNIIRGGLKNGSIQAVQYWSSEVNGRGRLGIYVGKTNSSSGGSTSVSIQVWFWTNYGAYDNSNTFYFNNNATSATTSRGSVSINHTVSSGGAWNTANQTRLGTYSCNYSRTTSTQTINCAAKLTGIDWVGSTLTFSTSYTIHALTSYTVSYNANGGSGAPPVKRNGTEKR